MQADEFTEIVHHLLIENKKLKKSLEIMEEILRSYLPVIEKKVE